MESAMVAGSKDWMGGNSAAMVMAAEQPKADRQSAISEAVAGYEKRLYSLDDLLSDLEAKICAVCVPINTGAEGPVKAGPGNPSPLAAHIEGLNDRLGHELQRIRALICRVDL